MGSPFFPQFLQGRAEDAYDALGTILRRAQMGAHGAVGGLGLPELEPMPGQQPIQSPSVVAAPPTTHALNLRPPREDAARPVQQDSEPARSVPSMRRGDEPEFGGLRGMDFRARPGALQEFDEDLGMMLPAGMRPRGGEGRGQGAGVAFPDADRTLFSSGAGDISTILGDIQRAELFGARNRAEAGETLSEAETERARQVMQDLIDPTRMQAEARGRTLAYERTLPEGSVSRFQFGNAGDDLMDVQQDAAPLGGPTIGEAAELRRRAAAAEIGRDPNERERRTITGELSAFEADLNQRVQGRAQIEALVRAGLITPERANEIIQSGKLLTEDQAEATLEDFRKSQALRADILAGRAVSSAVFPKPDPFSIGVTAERR